MKSNYFLLTFLIISTFFSCNNDEDIQLSNDIMGEWVRSDAHKAFEFKLLFNTDNTGSKIVREGTMATTITSSSSMFEWSVKETTLIIVGMNDFTESDFFFNKEGQLVIESYPDLVFNKAK
jgi:hypothetical protein